MRGEKDGERGRQRDRVRVGRKGRKGGVEYRMGKVRVQKERKDKGSRKRFGTYGM